MDISVIEANGQHSVIFTEDPPRKPVSLWQRCIPSDRKLRKIATQLLCLFLVYATLWGLLGRDALPGSEVFSFVLLIVSCHAGGMVISLVKLPPLIGMLITGFLFRNLTFLHYYQDISLKWASAFRNMALVVVLLRAGLGLDPSVLKKMSMVCLRLAFMPCMVESAVAAAAAHLLLGLPWAMCFALGFVLAAVSPAVVIPSMLLLAEKGLGEDKGITTILIAASSIDDVFAIMGFGVATGVAFSQGSIHWTVWKGPLEVLVGLAYGGVLGVLCWYFPHRLEKHKLLYRVILLTSGGLGVTFVSQSLHFPAAGALGCLSLAFVAALKWRAEKDNGVAEIEAGMWNLLQIFLFGLIGTEVSVADLQKDVGIGVLVLFIGLFFRLLTSFCVLFGSALNAKEKLFVAFAWLPKATVQAALGSVALDFARNSNYGEEYILYGKQILTIAVLSILITAPLGAIAIAVLGPVLLKKANDLANPRDSFARVEDTTHLQEPKANSHINYESLDIDKDVYGIEEAAL